MLKAVTFGGFVAIVLGTILAVVTLPVLGDATDKVEAEREVSQLKTELSAATARLMTFSTQLEILGDNVGKSDLIQRHADAAAKVHELQARLESAIQRYNKATERLDRKSKNGRAFFFE